MSLHARIAVLGGADPSDPLEPNNRVRHTAVGLLLLAVAAWAFTASTAAFHSNLKAPWPVAVLGGALIAVVVFSIDLLVTATPLKDETLGSRFKVIFVRGMVSLAMGLVISHATILFMYRDTLAQKVSDTNNAAAAAISDRVTATSKWTLPINQATSQVKADQNQIKATDQTLADAQARLAQLQKQWSDDQVCVSGNRAANGDQCGPGPSSNTLKAQADTYRDQTLPAVVRNHDDQIAALTTDIANQNKIIKDDTEQRAQEIKGATAATLSNTGLAAQTDALVDLLKHDLFAWLWPLFFIVIDLSVALMKGLLPESDFDRARRARWPLTEQIHRGLAGSPRMAEVLDHAALRQAELTKARIDLATDRQLVAMAAGKRSRTWPQWIPSRRQVAAGTALVLVVAALIALAALPGGHGDTTVPAGMTATGGQAIALRDGLTLRIPPRSVTNNAPVTAAYEAARPWAGHTPASATVEFTTRGQLVGKPVLSLPVPAGQEQTAQAGGFQLAFESDDPSGWTQYPATYDPATHSIVAELTHFSTWQFWTWDWASIGAGISQALGQLTGRRSSDTPDCSKGPQPPKWFNNAAGITSEPAMVVRSCVQGHAGDDVLDVQLVNNRPYGLMLHYNGAPIQYGGHEDAGSLPDAFRDIIGDVSAGSQGLYLPPLSRAWLGIKNLGNGANRTFPITATKATITADLFDAVGQEFLDHAVTAAGKKWVHDVFGAAAAGGCSNMVLAIGDHGIPDQATVYNLLTGDALKCIKGILTIAARKEIAQGAGMDLKTIGSLSGQIANMDRFMAVDEIAKIEGKLGDVLDFLIDKKYAAVPDLGFGFDILTHYAYQGPAAPTSTPHPTGPQPLTFSVTGACTTSGGTLSSSSAGFTPGGRYTVDVRRPNGTPYTGFTNIGTVRPGGDIAWTWPCAGDPAGTYTTDITDNASGRTTGWVPFTIGNASGGGQPPANPTAVNAYDNYGPVTQPGIPMCAGDPSRPESMPGGTVTQTFTIPAGVAYLDAATVQIDVNHSMTVHASLSINGTVRATNDQLANNDTTFAFARTTVQAGDTATLTLTWTATLGKLDTIYLTGTPSNSHLTITNTCSDGAPSLDRTDIGLRAVVSGWSA